MSMRDDYYELKKMFWEYCKGDIPPSQEVLRVYWRDLMWFRRKLLREPPLSLDDGLEDITATAVISCEEQIETRDLSQALYAAIGMLDAEDQLIVKLYFFEEKSQAETGKSIGLTQGAVSLRLRKITAVLRSYMEGYI